MAVVDSAASFFSVTRRHRQSGLRVFLGKVFIRKERSIEGHFVGISYHVSSGNSFMASWVRVPNPKNTFLDFKVFSSFSYERYKARIWRWKKIGSNFNPKIEIQSFRLTFGIRPFTSVHCSVAAFDAALTQHPSSLQCWFNSSEYVQLWVFHKKLVSKNELNFCIVCAILQVDVINQILIFLTFLSEFAASCHVVRIEETRLVKTKKSKTWKGLIFLPVDVEMSSGSFYFNLFFDIRCDFFVELREWHREIRLPAWIIGI